MSAPNARWERGRSGGALLRVSCTGSTVQHRRASRSALALGASCGALAQVPVRWRTCLLAFMLVQVVGSSERMPCSTKPKDPEPMGARQLGCAGKRVAMQPPPRLPPLFSQKQVAAAPHFRRHHMQCGACLVAAPRHGRSQRLCSRSGSQAGRLAVRGVPSTVVGLDHTNLSISSCAHGLISLFCHEHARTLHTQRPKHPRSIIRPTPRGSITALHDEHAGA